MKIGGLGCTFPAFQKIEDKRKFRIAVEVEKHEKKAKIALLTNRWREREE